MVVAAPKLCLRG